MKLKGTSNMGFLEISPRPSSMRQCLMLVLLVLMFVVLTQPSLVHGRALGAEMKKGKDDHPEAVDGGVIIGDASFSSAANRMGGRVFVRDGGIPLASGPSRKGSGH
ncbi:hypothetical protein I3843_02G001600 [Carya illinoinensis]|uniref:Uncharacterized protein n=1 Tax=Carya illinoinensis TaxID=32201 RepID=A0A922FQI8_CARIL|nr:hypothetical protein I3842_02G005900 [Carya illinoinensis]KAG7989960.1 hypothetical protein I3843_02G001600 [Carya illinoinensis]